MADPVYDESKELDAYLSRSFSMLATAADERREYERAAQEAKSKYADLTGRGTTHKRRKATQAQVDELLAVSRTIHDRIMQRIWQDIRSGSILINRCPKCSRIVCTALAKQCLWCGHDWHTT